MLQRLGELFNRKPEPAVGAPAWRRPRNLANRYPVNQSENGDSVLTTFYVGALGVSGVQAESDGGLTD